ncbi:MULTISPECIES: hypothetical protein [unclassified Pseudoalteromonas]|uniref:hypothetical protein n=1 Tax=unclassified Pseudoalteromonas TaxID=194690 RepID=UPI0025B3D217|nr:MULTISPECIES: hypothetical protein [unclassified Pseudoalteromonas]MDN3379189.1 hypothetical protein [Pseudoalteromonas sp. APC 3893]MDN3387684.1 hypothetical protein [Pseudoalteromonas sp. APC 4017]
MSYIQKIILLSTLLFSTFVLSAPSGIPANFQCPTSPVVNSNAAHSWNAVSGATRYKFYTRFFIEGDWEITSERLRYVNEPAAITLVGHGVRSYKSYVFACDASGCNQHGATCDFFSSADSNISAPETIAYDFEIGTHDFQLHSRWKKHTSSTPSPNTGPNRAYSGLYYLYFEASSAEEGDYYDAITPELEADTVSFYYHMYGSGAHMGNLQVEVFHNNKWHVIWFKGSVQHSSPYAPWTKAEIDLSSYPGAIKVKFSAEAGESYRGDMAIDQIEFITAESTNHSGNRNVVFIHTDLLGSPVAETDLHGAIQ